LLPQAKYAPSPTWGLETCVLGHGSDAGIGHLLMPLSLAMRFGVNFAVEAVYRRLRCKQCGARTDYIDVTLVGR
jgi:hypothetical protein